MINLAAKEMFAEQSSFRSLKEKIIDKSVQIGIIGLGYVGLPLVKAFCESGYRTTGFDVDEDKIQKLKQKTSYINSISDKTIANIIDTDQFNPTSMISMVAEVDVLIICVPTPLTSHKEPDLSYIISTVESFRPFLREGHMIVLESTTYPGTLKEVVQPILKNHNLVLGKDYFLGYSPEREDPGNLNFDTRKIPKVIGADDPASKELCSLLYKQVIDVVYEVSSSCTAEAVKLTENIFRSVNIALVNELKVVFDKMGIDIWEVIEAAKSKPFGYMPFYPGPGLGGHCIPIDPFYLAWKAREYGVTTRFIELAGQINNYMPDYVIQKLLEALDKKFTKGFNKSKILILGIAYKKNVNDMRESPALAIINKLEKYGSNVDYYDPYISEIPKTRNHAFVSKKSVQLEDNIIASYDAILISTDHDNVDYEKVVKNGKLIVDTRNATKNVSLGRDKIVKA